MKIRFLVLLLAISLFVSNCSEKEGDPKPQEETEFNLTDFTEEGYAGQLAVLTITRSNDNTPFPQKENLEVLFGNQTVTINTLTKSQLNTTLEVIVPAGYTDETVDIRIRTKVGAFFDITQEDAFTYNTPRITEAPQNVLFDSTFQIKIPNRPVSSTTFALERVSDGLSHTLTVVKIEGDNVWLKATQGHSTIGYNPYRVRTYINGMIAIYSSEISFRPSFEFHYQEGGSPETLVIRVNKAVIRTAPIVKMNDITLVNRWKWTITDLNVYEYGYTLPINTAIGEYTLTVTSPASDPTPVTYLPLDGNVFTYEGGGPGIKTYTNIKLGGVNTQATIGSMFSTATGLVYKNGNSNGSELDIVYVGTSGLQFFESPTKAQDWGLTEILYATQTHFVNYIENSGITFTTAMFDNMTNDTAVKSLVIPNDQESFPGGAPRIILFANAAGKKGVIKIKELVTGPDGYVVFDLKVQE